MTNVKVVQQTDMAKQYVPAIATGDIKSEKKKKKHSKIIKQEKMPNGIMDGFFSKVNQSVNLGRCPTPSHPPAQTSLFYRTDF